ncbi:hypothetical protein ACP70R_028071 [Stipagrostis hirtigluma subsp. patula]
MRRFFHHLLPCILLLFFVMSHLPISSLSLRAIREEAWSDFRAHELPPTISPSQEVGGDDDANKYAVSRRTVPQGPNPLHNR